MLDFGWDPEFDTRGVESADLECVDTFVDPLEEYNRDLVRACALLREGTVTWDRFLVFIQVLLKRSYLKGMLK